MDKVGFIRWINERDETLFNIETFFREGYFVFGNNKIDLSSEANLIAMKRQMLAEIKNEVLKGAFDR